jgi:acetyl-CoA carboxylase biotin carboxylase subunit
MTKTTLGKVLIANRGEIAVRVVRACRELGIKTVAVYSEVDAGAPHVLVADDAHCIGPADPAQSYLNIERLIDVARLTGAKAVHPGYGFLSENPAFAAACRDAGLIFIGPTAETIELLGDKARARELAIEANVPVLAGKLAPDDETALRQAAEQIGYPVMLKAAAGGGGKGMRVVRDAAELWQRYGSARREARSAFGNDTILIERFIERPRHIEMQILADHEGNMVYLGERECSVQRRHQKIIEESPSPLMDEAVSLEAGQAGASMRQRMGEAALRLAKAAGYRNAGTVEFLVAPDGEFYFLEVNTRLQVEHPVTELVTRLDLVHQQLRVAADETLDLSQADVSLRGHAIEARLYAEDPERDFAPSPGKVLHLYEPQFAGLRIDSGVRQGQIVPVSYDPILAKLIAWAPTRDGAIARLLEGLSEYALLGVKTNKSYLEEILDHPAFRAAELATDFIPRHFADYQVPAPSAEQVALAATMLSLEQRPRTVTCAPQRLDPWDTLDGWRLT